MALKTGISGFDDLLRGGLPELASVLFEGLPGCGKDCFAYAFLLNQVKEGKVGFIAYSGLSNRDIKDVFESHGMRISDDSVANLLYWIDTEARDDGRNVIRVEQGTLTEISITLSKYLETNKNKGMVGVVQLLDAALMLNSPKEIYRFVKELVQKLKRYNTTSVFLIEKGMHAPESVVMLESLSDGVVEFKLFEQGFDVKRGLRVVKMRGATP
jgi:circadian clock protein KaiC